MKLLRIPEGNWRPDARQLFHFGTYRVPTDMPEDLAQRAVAEGVAQWVGDAAPAASASEPAPAVPRRKRTGNE